MTRRSILRDQRGSAYTEALVIIGLLLIPIFFTLEFVKDAGGAQVLLSTKVRQDALTQAFQRCSGACGVAGATADLPPTPSPLSRYSNVPRDLRFSSCEQSATASSIAGRSATFTRRNGYACTDEDAGGGPPDLRDLGCQLAEGDVRSAVCR